MENLAIKTLDFDLIDLDLYVEELQAFLKKQEAQTNDKNSNY